MNKFLTFCLALGLSFNALALDLKGAKTTGLVGETLTGYIAAVSTSPNAETAALVKDINSKRKAAYQERATKAGVELKVIEIRIGQRLYKRASAGAHLQDKNGNWYKK